MKKICIYMILMLCWTGSGLIAQEAEKSTEEMNLAKIADDLKFQNGVQFIRLRQYDKARVEFQEYLEVFHDGIHRHEAFRELADIYYNRFDFQKAVDVLKSLYEEFSNTEEGIEAFYKIGICYKKMGYDADARRVFAQIMVDHPDSGYAQQSRMQLDLLKIINEN